MPHFATFGFPFPQLLSCKHSGTVTPSIFHLQDSSINIHRSEKPCVWKRGGAGRTINLHFCAKSTEASAKTAKVKMAKVKYISFLRSHGDTHADQPTTIAINKFYQILTLPRTTGVGTNRLQMKFPQYQRAERRDQPTTHMNFVNCQRSRRKKQKELHMIFWNTEERDAKKTTYRWAW